MLIIIVYYVVYFQCELYIKKNHLTHYSIALDMKIKINK